MSATRHNRSGGRDLRVADFVRDELAQIIQREMRDPRVGLVSISEVKVSRDLSFADVYVSTLINSEPAQQVELIEVLSKAAGYFRSELAKRHKMRTTPRLRFHYDALVESAPRMESLIAEARSADAQVAAARDESSDSLQESAYSSDESTDSSKESAYSSDESTDSSKESDNHG